MRYVAGTDLTLSVPLVDAEGNTVEASSVAYSILNGDGLTIQAETPLAGFTPGNTAQVLVPAALNTIGVAATREAREVRFLCTTEAGPKIVSFNYVIVSANGTLVRGVNSMVTLASADMIAGDMSKLDGWKSATAQAKSNALAEAYQRLGKLKLRTVGDNDHYVREGPFRSSLSTSLTDLSVTEVLNLDKKLSAALSFAQVAEADVILSGDSIAERRREGLVLDMVGEVKQQFNNAKPLELPISRRALDYLSAFVSLGVKGLGRS